MVKSSGHLAVAVGERDEDTEMNPRKKKEKKKIDVDIDISGTGSLRFMTNKVYLHVGVVSNGLNSDYTCWTVACVLMLYWNGHGNYFKFG